MQEQAHQLFIRFLNRSYYIKSHLSERLDELIGFALFAELQDVITATISSLELQLNESNKLFEALDIASSMDECESTFVLLESVFTTVQSPENTTPLLSLLDYVSIADALLAESAKMVEIYRDQLTAPYILNHDLYVATTLQPLKIMLEESIIVT